MLILIAKILMRKCFPIHKLFKKMCLTGSIFLCVLTHFGTTVLRCAALHSTPLRFANGLVRSWESCDV